MGQLIVTHTALHIITAPLAIAVFLGLAIYVITCNPYRPASWVFSSLCLTLASIYLSSFFTKSAFHHPFSLVDFMMHWKWVAIALSATLYLQLIFFYFPSSWQRYRLWILLPAYLFNAGLTFMALATDLLIADHFYELAGHFTSPRSFMVFYAGFLALEMIAGLVGLFFSYRSSHSPSFRQQVVYLLLITSVGLVGGLIEWLTLLTHTTGHALHLLPDTLLIVAAVLYAQAVVRYGLLVGRPLARRSLFYSALATVFGLAALYLAFILDQWLLIYTAFPYYLATGILVLTFATSFPTLSQWLTRRLDKWFFQAERHQQALAGNLVEALAEAPTFTQLQAELLEALRLILGVTNGYVALSKPDTPPGKMTVQLVQGNLSLQPGEMIRRPPLHGKEPHLVAALLPQPYTEPSWQDIALFCPITFDREVAGVVALGEKRDRTPFSLPELVLCAELVKQLDTVGPVRRLRKQYNDYLEAARQQAQTLQHLRKEITPSAHAIPSTRESQPAPVEIRVLGPLQVTRQGQLVVEAAWGSEKAKGLLAYLLWKSPTGVTREELSEALWPGRPVDETANVFHVTLHRLRRVLQANPGQGASLSYIQHDRRRYRFNTEAPHWLDLTEFQALVARDELGCMKAAVKLYQGAYLEDMMWALPAEAEAKRHRLEQLYASALRSLAAQANSQEAMLYLEKLLAVEPADEMTHRALVLGYLARGRGDLARRQVSNWQQALAEFDLEPSPETKAVWRMVKAKEPP